jgi:hypothetical protein
MSCRSAARPVVHVQGGIASPAAVRLRPTPAGDTHHTRDPSAEGENGDRLAPPETAALRGSAIVQRPAPSADVGRQDRNNDVHHRRAAGWGAQNLGSASCRWAAPSASSRPAWPRSAASPSNRSARRHNCPCGCCERVVRGPSCRGNRDWRRC